MSIASQISALTTDRNDIRAALVEQGVEEASSHGFDDFAEDIASIVSGGGSAITITETPEAHGGTVLEITAVDLTGDTVTPARLLSGYTAHDSKGNPITGTVAPGITPTGTISITTNGTHDVTEYASASVNVSSSGSDKNAQILSGISRVNTTSYTAVSGMTLTVAKTGTYDVYWIGYRSSTSGTSGSQLYIDSTAYGSAQTSFNSSYTNWQLVHLSNVSLTKDQTVTVRARSRGTNYYMYISNFTIIEA